MRVEVIKALSISLETGRPPLREEISGDPKDGFNRYLAYGSKCRNKRQTGGEGTWREFPTWESQRVSIARAMNGRTCT